jgi:peptide/nickel transport system permease protein
MLTNAQSYLYSLPWLAVYPGLMILTTVVAVNVLGDALRDAAEPADHHR